MDNFIYTTIDGQRWDNVSYACYGVADMYEVIIRANPDVPLFDILPGGIDLIIPVIATTTPATDNSLLPIWKQV